MANDGSVVEMKTLGDAFPEEIQRLTELVRVYKELGLPVSFFALSHIEPCLAAAQKAWAEQDVVAMVRLYPEMQSKE